MSKVISVQNLVKQFTFYKKPEGLKGAIKSLFHRETLIKKAIDNISFEVNKGEFIGFIGKNGAGKTTTLKLLTGLLYPTSGNINVLGHIPAERKNAYKRKFAIVLGQKSQLIDVIPPLESFKLYAAIYDLDENKFRKKVKNLAEMLDVSDILQVQTRKLSLGQRMKCELIAALLHDPEILFLDEPSIGLDIVSQQAIRKFLAEYNKKYQTTILLTSHYMDDVESLCERLIIIDNGKIGYDGKLNTLIKKYSRKRLIQIECFEKIQQIPDHPGIILATKKNDFSLDLEVENSQTAKVIEQLFQNYKVRDIKIENVTLEEVVSDIFNKKL